MKALFMPHAAQPSAALLLDPARFRGELDGQAVKLFTLRLSYRVTEANELVLDYQAMALDQPSIASFTSHAFFNLNGESSGSALGHEVMICADRYLAMNAELIATGDVLPVADTPFDFREAMRLNTRVRGLPMNEQVDGYDSCYLVNPSATGALALCARASAPESGRVMEVWSTE